MYNPNLNNILIVDVKDLKDLGFLTEELDEILVPNAIKYVQDSKVQNALGTKLYFILLEEINKKCDDDLYIIPEKYNILLSNYIYTAVGYLVNGELMLPMTLKMKNKGLIESSDDRVTPQDSYTVKSTKTYYDDRGEFYLDMLVKYIQQNYQTYPEFFSVGSYDKVSDTNVYKSSIYFPKKCGNNGGRCTTIFV